MTTDLMTIPAGEVQTNEKTFKALVADWLTELATGEENGKRNKSQRTIDAYAYSLKDFGNWLETENISAPTKKNVVAWKNSLDSRRNRKGEPWSVATKNLYVSSVKNFFKWLSDKYDVANIAAGIEGWKATKEHKRGVLTLDEMKRLLATVKTADLRGNRNIITKTDERTMQLRRVRDYAILAVLMGGGLRTVEVTRLRVADFYRNGGVAFLNVLGKGKDDKVDVKISSQVEDAIQAWLSAREAVDIITDNSPLFCSLGNKNFGDDLHTHTISKMCKFYLELAGLKNKIETNLSDNKKTKIKPIVAHSLRASLATNSYRSGAKLDQVQQQLRHENVATTLIYIHEAEKMCNPCTDIISAAIF